MSGVIRTYVNAVKIDNLRRSVGSSKTQGIKNYVNRELILAEETIIDGTEVSKCSEHVLIMLKMRLKNKNEGKLPRRN